MNEYSFTKFQNEYFEKNVKLYLTKQKFYRVLEVWKEWESIIQIPYNNKVLSLNSESEFMLLVRRKDLAYEELLKLSTSIFEQNEEIEHLESIYNNTLLSNNISLLKQTEEKVRLLYK